jgi:hypothetical protein
MAKFDFTVSIIIDAPDDYDEDQAEELLEQEISCSFDVCSVERHD